MAQFMHGCGLQRFSPLSGAEQHIHRGLQSPLALLPLGRHHLQQGTAMAGPGTSRLIDGERGAAAPDPQLGCCLVPDPPHGQQFGPGIEGALNGPEPAPLPRIFGVRGRLDPYAPLGKARPTEGRAAQR